MFGSVWYYVLTTWNKVIILIRNHTRAIEKFRSQHLKSMDAFENHRDSQLIKCCPACSTHVAIFLTQFACLVILTLAEIFMKSPILKKRTLFATKNSSPTEALCILKLTSIYTYHICIYMYIYTYMYIYKLLVADLIRKWMGSIINWKKIFVIKCDSIITLVYIREWSGKLLKLKPKYNTLNKMPFKFLVCLVPAMLFKVVSMY